MQYSLMYRDRTLLLFARRSNRIKKLRNIAMTVLIMEDPQLIARYELARNTSQVMHDSPPCVSPILFAPEQANLNPADEGELRAHANFLKSCRRQVLQIHGHADRIGKPAHNLQLSRDRAQTVKAFLLAEGVAAEQLQHFAWGAADPLRQSADHCDNRRVELIYVAR